MDTTGDIIYKQFNTRDRNGAPITFAGSPTVAIRKDNGTTTDSDGVSLLIDSGSVTGLHILTIDTSQDEVFYTTNHKFFAIVTAGTVDGVSVVGEIVFEFELGEIPSNVTKWNSSTLPDVATQSDIDGLNDLSSDDIETAVTTSLNSYGPPTKIEMDNAINGLNDLSSDDIETAVTTSLNSYGPPTKIEMYNAISGIYGTGAIKIIYEVIDSDTGNPIPNVFVWVTLNIDDDPADAFAEGYTDQSGKITFYLNAGTVFFWKQLAGYTFTNPDQREVT